MYQDIEYSGDLKTFIMVMNDYKWLEPGWESINPLVVVYWEPFRAYGWAKNGSKIPDNSPKYKAIKFSGGIKNFTNQYEWEYIV